MPPIIGAHQLDQQPNLLDQVARIQQIRGQQQEQQLRAQQGQQQAQLGQQQGQINQLDIQQKQRQAQDQQAVQQAIAENPGATLHDILPKLGTVVSAQTYIELQKADVGMQKQYADLDESKLKVAAQSHAQLQEVYNNVMQLPDDQAVASQWPIIAQTVNAIPGSPIKLDPNKPLPKEALAQAGPGLALNDAYLKNVMAQREQKAKADAAATEAEQKARVLAGTNAQGVTGDQQATLAQGQKRLGLEAGRLAEEKRHNQASEGSLTPEAVSMAAQQYAQTGVMPSLGRTAAIRTQIMNEAARVYPKVDLASNAAAFKANQESLKKLQGQTDQVEAFENTAGKNLDLFLNQAKKVIDTGSPWINRPLRLVGQQGLGSSDLAAMNAARQIAINEVAKVTSNPGMSGQLSDTARKEVEAFNPQDATFAQTVKVAAVLKQDMANRKQSNLDQIADIKKRISGGTSQPDQPSTRRVIDLTK